MSEYTVQKLAEMAGVSVRTLHHYDRIGLLRPSRRTNSGYRLYDEKELLRLQQILFYRELEFPLAEILAVLDRPDFDPLAALEEHRNLLEVRAARITSLLSTIDRTILKLKGEDEMLSDEELYEGFSKEKIERYKREAREAYGNENVERTERKVKNWSKDKWNALKKEQDEVAKSLAALMTRSPGDPEVQALVARHKAGIENFYPLTAEIYSGLAGMYVEHPEFRAYYEQYAPGFADFLRAAILCYIKNTEW